MKSLMESLLNGEIKTIDMQSVGIAFRSGNVMDVTVHQISSGWLFTFRAFDAVNGKLNTFALRTQRGAIRMWANPQNLFDFLSKHGVTAGSFKLQEG